MLYITVRFARGLFTIVCNHSRSVCSGSKKEDKEEERKQKKRQLFNLFKKLGAEQNRQKLGLLLRTFNIEDTEIFNMHEEAVRLFRAQAAEPPASSDKTEGVPTDVEVDNWNPLDDDCVDVAPPRAVPASESPVNDEEAFFASYVESAWIGRLRIQAEDPALQSYFQLPQQEFASLVSELSTGAARLHLQDTMAEAFREAGRYVNTSPDRILRQQAGMAARIINSYVAWLGLNPHGDVSERTVHNEGKDIELFTPPSPVRDFPVLSENRTRYADVWFSDWLKALYVLGMENVNFDGNETINVAENDILKNIIKNIERNPE